MSHSENANDDGRGEEGLGAKLRGAASFAVPREIGGRGRENVDLGTAKAGEDQMQH